MIIISTSITVDSLFTQLHKVDFVVASRLHGILIAHLAKKPVIAISYVRKVDTYMKDMEQRDYCLDIHDLKIEECIEKFDLMRSNVKQIKSTIRSKTRHYNMLLEKQYDMICHLGK